MVYGRHRVLAIAATVSLLALCATPVLAQISDTIHPFVYARITSDDNVFRSERLPEKDIITRLGGGVDVELPVSRQTFGASVRAEQAAYKENTNLDHNNLEGRALWDWVVGNRWSGDLGFRYFNTIASFDETVTRTKNNRTDTRAYGSANFLLTPDLELVGTFAGETTRIDNRPEVDNDTGTLSGEVRIALGPRTRFGARLAQSVADFLYLEELDNGLLVSNDYTAYNASGTVYWEGTGKSTLSARVGYTSVQHEQLTSRDVDGRAYRGDYLWSITDATNVNFAVWQDANNREEVAGVVLTKGAEIRPSWRMTELIHFTLQAAYEEVDYEGDVTYIVRLGETRKDNISRAGATLSYELTRMTNVSLSYAWVDRESNNPGSSYTYNAITLAGRMNF